MKALVCRQPGELRLETRAMPVPQAGEALIRIRRIGVCGTDFHIMEGLHPFLEYPRIMGHELGAEIAEAPAESGFKPGDPVVVNPYIACGTCVACRKGKPNCCTNIAVLGVHRDGGMCEWLSVPLGNLYKADGLSLDQAAMAEFLAIGAHAVRRAEISSGDRTLVIGAGPIGLGTALFAALDGGQVTLMDIDEGRLAMAREKIGVASTLLADADLAEKVKAATDGEGFDRVFDATGNKTSMQGGLFHLAHGGTYVLISVVKDTIGFPHPEFHKRETTLKSSRNATREDFERVMQAMRSGQVPTEKLATHSAALDEVPDALPRWVKARSELVKALVTL